MARILVADDKIDLRDKYTSIILRNHPHTQVDQVSTGEDLVMSAKHIKYDLIFTDDDMGSDIMSGTSAILKIRKFDKHTPIIMVSACYCSDESIAKERNEELIGLGGSGFIDKNSKHLEDSIEAAIKKYSR